MIADADWMTKFIYAAESGNIDGLQEGLGKSSNPHFSTVMTQAMSLACLRKRWPIVEMLMEQGADIQIFDNQPIRLALYDKQWDLLKKMLLTVSPLDYSTVFSLVYPVIVENGQHDVFEKAFNRLQETFETVKKDSIHKDNYWLYFRNLSDVSLDVLKYAISKKRYNMAMFVVSQLPKNIWDNHKNILEMTTGSVAVCPNWQEFRALLDRDTLLNTLSQNEQLSHLFAQDPPNSHKKSRKI